MNINELTPVEEINGLLFKRDDLFKPFKGSNIGGGKVRQCLAIMEANKERIKSDFSSKVATHTSVKSPQGLIVARCANEFGFECIVGIGSQSVEASIRRHKLLRLATEFADVRKISGPARNNRILDLRLRELQKRENFYPVNFGKAAYEVMPPIMNQCKNLPDELDYLIVPSGSCVTLAAVAEGVKLFGKKVKNVIGVQVHGYDRRKEIEKLTTTPKPKLFVDKTYKEREWTMIKDYSYGGIELDAHYEARAFKWLLKKINFRKRRTLFWVVANFNEFRF